MCLRFRSPNHSVINMKSSAAAVASLYDALITNQENRELQTKVKIKDLVQVEMATDDMVVSSSRGKFSKLAVLKHRYDGTKGNENTLSKANLNSQSCNVFLVDTLPV